MLVPSPGVGLVGAVAVEVEGQARRRAVGIARARGHGHRLAGRGVARAPRRSRPAAGGCRGGRRGRCVRIVVAPASSVIRARVVCGPTHRVVVGVLGVRVLTGREGRGAPRTRRRRGCRTRSWPRGRPGPSRRRRPRSWSRPRVTGVDEPQAPRRPRVRGVDGSVRRSLPTRPSASVERTATLPERAAVIVTLRRPRRRTPRRRRDPTRASRPARDSPRSGRRSSPPAGPRAARGSTATGRGVIARRSDRRERGGEARAARRPRPDPYAATVAAG